MRLLVIRHGPAGNRETWAAESGLPDEVRPLTERGRDRMEAAARGIGGLVDDVEILATSPLTRSSQSAEIVAAALGSPELVLLEALRPERDPAELAHWLRELNVNGAVGVVGHEPHLGLLVGWLLTGRAEAPVELKKGAAALLELADPVAQGGGRLLWSLAPRHLRSLGKAK
jgi:phosphohistidine phosphatase